MKCEMTAAQAKFKLEFMLLMISAGRMDEAGQAVTDVMNYLVDQIEREEAKK